MFSQLLARFAVDGEAKVRDWLIQSEGESLQMLLAIMEKFRGTSTNADKCDLAVFLCHQASRSCFC